MSSLSTLPKGDSAWLLRKSIQRIMQQVSVLETNIGSSTTGNSANTQVIFNDDGTLRGDTGLTYNKTTDLLSVGAATITGDLTLSAGTANGVPYLNASKVVTTSDKLSFAQTGGFFSTTFNINSLLGVANYKAGIVVTEDNNSFSLYGGSGYKLIDAYGYSTPNQLRFYASNVEQYRIDASGVFNWYDGAGGTRMTLNATGLGVGGSPTEKLSVNGSLGLQNGGTQRWHISATSGSDLVFTRSTVADRLTITSDGNVGIGVTPSAWGTYKALEIGTIGTGLAGQGYETHLLANCYYNAGWKYARTERAARFVVGEGLNDFRWFTAPSGTAGNAITFTQAMTLDASGNLLVGTTSSPSGAKVGAITKLSGVSAEGTASINVSTTPVALSRVTGTSGLFFVMGYNASGGAQGWYLVASTGAGTPTVISSGGTPGLTLTFTMSGGQLNAQTASGTFVANAFSITA